MHELALAQSVIALVETTARRHAARCVTRVRLEIGALSHVSPAALQFCFDAAARGTLAERARLDILATPGEGWCMPCGATVKIANRGEPCPACGSYQLTVVRGDEMAVKDIDVS
ncbi:MAG TPA: hydrogenase maturation nickel metallochaperone HypA [Casimicrobiaceae bacterium]|nr:hydrogenase maturation nickel metallochaperone HypA [Casimicrobiaceae bacterium]